MPMPHATFARSARLVRAFRSEQRDPHRFYTFLAADTVAQLSGYADLAGALVADIGSGPGYFMNAFATAGAHCVGVDCDAGELTMHGSPPPGSVLGSAVGLPLRTGSVDVCFSSNVLEHVSVPWRMADEMVRVTKPGGIVYLSFTNWLSPWGGHETSPWHYLGGELAARRYQRRHGRPPKNRYGVSLHPVSVGSALAWARRRTDVRLVDAVPRYYPHWVRSIVAIPGLREFATWNLVLVLEKSAT